MCRGSTTLVPDALLPFWASNLATCDTLRSVIGVLTFRLPYGLSELRSNLARAEPPMMMAVILLNEQDVDIGMAALVGRLAARQRVSLAVLLTDNFIVLVATPSIRKDLSATLAQFECILAC